MPTIMVNVTKTKYDAAMVVGARPNFVKVAPLLNKFEDNNLNVLFIHTGQHWDKNMSEDIFQDLELRQPDIHLNIQNKFDVILNMEIIEHVEDVDFFLKSCSKLLKIQNFYLF